MTYDSGHDVYVAPFARLGAMDHPIIVGPRSNVQDSVDISTVRGPVRLGTQAMLAHGASARGPASIGMSGTCRPQRCASIVMINSRVDGGVVEHDVMDQPLARVGPGVTIPSGRKVLPGRSVDSQAEVATETEPLTAADREFMDSVIHINVGLARGYRRLAVHHVGDVRGIGPDPGHFSFNPRSDLPRLAGRLTRRPRFRNRIIGRYQCPCCQSTLVDQ